MRKTRFFLCVLTVLLTIPYFSALATTINCDGGIISLGDRNMDVMAKCGSPDFRDSHKQHGRDKETGERMSIIVEEWTYNLGPNQLTRIIVLKNGVVTEIRTGNNYGYVKK